jgi:hypothetical protein
MFSPPVSVSLVVACGDVHVFLELCTGHSVRHSAGLPIRHEPRGSRAQGPPQPSPAKQINEKETSKM